MSSADDLRDVHPGRQVFAIALAFAATIPGLVIRLGHIEVSHPVAALLYGLAIVGAAFMLSWAAEVAQLDISAGLAIAVLAFIAVLPEYAVDLVFAFKAGQSVAEWGPACRPPDGAGETPCSLALANMTGANRLLIGIGWSMVVFIAWYRSRAQGIRLTAVALERSHAIELSYLAVATAYSLTLPLKSTVTLLDAAVLVGIFVLYTIRIAGAPAEEPHLVGPARYLGTFATAGGGSGRCPLRLRGDGDPAGRRALRRGAGCDRSRPRHQRVPARAVARAAGIGGSGAARRRPVRLAAEHERGSRHAGVVQGEPVDAAGRHAAHRVRAGVGGHRRPAGRVAPTRRAAAHRRAVGVRRRHADRRSPSRCRRRRCCSGCSSPSS